jgi:predicted DNA-binding protein
MGLAVRLPPEIEQRLQSLAERTGRSKAFHAREAILRYLDVLEDERLHPVLQTEETARGRERAGGDDPFACFEEWASGTDTLGYSLLGRSDGPARD